MKVALLTREYPPEVYGGAGVHVAELAAALDRRRDVDVEVRCFGAQRDDPLVAAAVEPWSVLGGERPADAALRTLSVDLALADGADAVDVVHSHTWYANLAGHLARLLWDVPHVATTHSLEPLRPWKAEQLRGGYRVSSWCERTGLEGADAVIAVSARMRDDVLECYPAVEPARVHVIHNGIDPNAWAPDADADLIEARGVDLSRPYVAYVGRITRQKGLVHLLDAVALLDPDVQVVLAAGAPDEPGILAEVEAAVEDLQRGRKGVVWLPELLDRATVVQLLSHATAFVCPSIYEPFGLVNVEAMACGAAVVASSVGGIPEVVVDGETGLLVDFTPGDDPYGSPADPGAYARDLAAAISELVADPARARRMGAAGRARVSESFTWDAVAARTAQLYATLV